MNYLLSKYDPFKKISKHKFKLNKTLVFKKQSLLKHTTKNFINKKDP